MALDVGCGTGRYTLPLAPHFKKVVGIDISESQLSVAKQNTLSDNVSYMVAPAEKLPMENDSVDLVNAALAAHWFTADKFVSEAVRVLKKKGCLAVHGLHPVFKTEYEDLSHELSEVMSEVWGTLSEYSDKNTELINNQYHHLYEAIPLKDKKWITDIPVTVQMSIAEFIGVIRSAYPFQILVEKDVERAEQFLKHTKRSFQKILGEKTDFVRLNVHIKHYCVFACKH